MVAFLLNERVANAFPDASPFCDRCDLQVPATPLQVYCECPANDTSKDLAVDKSQLLKLDAAIGADGLLLLLAMRLAACLLR